MPDTGSSLHIEIVGDEAGLAALEAPWRALERRCGAADRAPGFEETWRAWTMVARPLGARPAIVVGRSGPGRGSAERGGAEPGEAGPGDGGPGDGEVELIWPLMRRGRVVEAMSGSPFGNVEVLVAPEARAAAWVAAAWDSLRRGAGGSCLVLRGVPEGSALASLGGEREAFRAGRVSPVIRLAAWGSWERYETRLSWNSKRDQRRQWRRVAAMPGEVRFHRAASREEAAAALDTYVSLKLRWFKAQGIATRLHTAEPYRTFNRANLLALYDGGRLMIGWLGPGQGFGSGQGLGPGSEGAAMAVGFGTVRGERFLFEGLAYAAEHARISPARLVLEHLVRWSFERQLAVFDFGPGDAAYKRRWADSSERVFDDVIPLDAWGHVMAIWHHGALRRLARLGWLRAAYRRLPQGARNVAHALLLPGVDYSAGSQRDDGA